MGKISSRKCVIRIFSKDHAVVRKSSKTIITREQRREGTNPFQVFHTSSRSTYRQKIESKRVEHFNMFPRKLWIKTLPRHLLSLLFKPICL